MSGSGVNLRLPDGTPIAAAPSYATARNPEAKTWGGWVAQVAKFLGTPLMPWQRLVADTALEENPARPGALRYKKIIITVPRQAGKTTLLRAITVARALSRPMEIYYTAQTRKAAVKKWRELADPLPKLMGNHRGQPCASYTRGIGNEALTLFNGSLISPFAPKADGLDGVTSPLVQIDEAFSFTLEEGRALLASAEPVGITFKDAQIWIVSTAGHAKSTWLKELVEQGRAAVNEPNSPIAFFEWSADPEAAARDPYSLETLSFHPALGYTQSLEDLLQTAKGTPLPVWRRAYLNLWSDESASVIDPVAWAALETPTQPGPQGLHYGAAPAWDRQGGAIYAATCDDEGTITLTNVASAQGTAWLEPALCSIYDENAPLSVGIDDAGHGRVIGGDLQDLGYPIHRLTPREWATACSWFIEAVGEAKILHCPCPDLDEQLAYALMRPLGGGAAFSEQKSPGPIDHLKAAIIAAWHAKQTGAGAIF